MPLSWMLWKNISRKVNIVQAAYQWLDLPNSPNDHGDSTPNGKIKTGIFNWGGCFPTTLVLPHIVCFCVCGSLEVQKYEIFRHSVYSHFSFWEIF